MFDFGPATLIVFGLIVIVALLIAYMGSRYKVAGANEALIRSGSRRGGTDQGDGLRVVRGGGLIVLPLFHSLGRLKLTARQINVTLSDAVTSQGIKVALEGVATFKVGADETSIRNAAERFLETDIREVDDIVKNVLEGSLRSIVGTLTVEELNLDRQKFQQAVQGAAIGDLATSGLVIDSFTIQAIGGEALEYMELVGRQELARRERDARMAQATADQEAKVREAEAQEIKLDAERGVELRRADVKKETEAAHARPESRHSSLSWKPNARPRSCSPPPCDQPKQMPKPSSSVPRATVEPPSPLPRPRPSRFACMVRPRRSSSTRSVKPKLPRSRCGPTPIATSTTLPSWPPSCGIFPTWWLLQRSPSATSTT